MDILLKSFKLLLLSFSFLTVIMADRAEAERTADANLKWIYAPVDDDGDTVDVRTDPVVGADGTIYVYCRDRMLHAVNPDGTVKWRYQGINESDYTSTPVIGPDGTIYVADENFLHAITATGQLKWRIPCPTMKMPPAIGPDGVIYVAGIYKLHAISPDGTVKWLCDVDAATRFSPAIGPNGTIYMGGDTSHIYAVNPWGTIKWKFRTRYDTFDAAPSIDADGTIYVTNHGHCVYAINADGTQKWLYDMGDPAWCTPAIAADGTIYVCGGSTSEMGLNALNPDGALKWIYPAPSYMFRSSASIGGDGTVYFGGYDNYFYAINPDGTLKWRFDAGKGISGFPAISSDGTVYLSTDVLYAFQTETYGYQAGAPWPHRMNNNTRSIAGNVTLPPLYTVRGQVALPDSTPLVDVDVSVDGLIATTDDYGFFTFSLPNGDYTINFLIDSTVIPKSVDVTVNGANVFVEMYQPANHMVEGRVLDRDGPVSGVSVSISSAICVTDENGRYFFSLADGEHTLSLSTGEESFPTFKDIVVDGDDVNVEDIILHRKAWTRSFVNTSHESPLVGPDGTLYFIESLIDDIALHAIDPDGVTLHEFIINIPVYHIPALAKDGTLYVSTDRIIALTSGLEHKWTFDPPEEGALTAPAIDEDGTVFFAAPGKLYALNPDGAIRWEYPVGQMGCDSPVIAGDGAIYFPCADGNLYTINPDGTPKWILPINTSSFRSPAIGRDGTLYFGGYDSMFRAVTSDGIIKWETEIDNACSAQATIDDDGNIYLVVQGCRVFSIDPEGNIRWSRQVSYEEAMYQPYYYEPCDEIWIWDGNETIALHPDGAVKWRHDQALVFPTTGTNGRMYVCEYPDIRGMKLHAYDMAVTHPQVGIEDSMDGNLDPAALSMISLHRNYPNPFNPVTTISFALAAESLVTVDIYTITGQHAGCLAHERMTAGEHRINWDGSNHPAGVYFARIAAGDAVSVRKMLLLK